MNKVLVFCSNPINGGTAEVFIEMCKEITSRKKQDIQIVPCVDKANDVKVYDVLEGLIRLDLVSEVQLLGELGVNRNFLEKVITRINRNRLYQIQKKVNMNIMSNFFSKNDFQTVLIHNGGYIGDDLCNQLLQVAYQAGIKNRIMVFHSDFKKNMFQKWLCMKYDWKINQFCTQVVTVSQFTRDRILKNSFLNKDMKVIYNGVTFDNTLSEKEKKRILKYREANIHIGMIGNFLDNKGQIQFLEALHQVLIKTDKSIQVSMIGNVYDKVYFERCKRYIKEHNMENVITIFHNIYQAKEYMNLFDFTVVPSMYDESFGLICVESMRNGTPVVAFACGGIPEVVKHGRDGYIVQVGNVKALSDSMLKMINQPNIIHKMGSWAKEDYKTYFSRKVMGDNYLKLLALEE